MSYSFNYTGERAAVKRAVENDPQIPDSIKAIVRETLHERLPEHSKEINGVTVSGFGHVNNGDDSALGNLQNFFITPIKLTLAILLLAILAVAFAPAAEAQTVTNAPPPPPNPENFFQSAEGYLTTFNSDYSWASNRLEFAVGADYQSGMQWANDIEGQYDVNGGNFILGARLRNAGIGGVVEMAQAKVGYSLITYEDTRVEASLYAGYDNEYRCAVVEPELDLRKKLTENTFAGIYISEPIFVQKSFGNQWVPNIGLETGFTF